MASRRDSAWLPYRREPVFDLVADIERYPEFVPGWAGARILSREGNCLAVEQTITVGGFRDRFVSEARLERPKRIVVCSREGMFKSLEIDWRFTDTGGGCELALNINYRFASRTLEFVAVPLFDHMAGHILQAFMQRARREIPLR